MAPPLHAWKFLSKSPSVCAGDRLPPMGSAGRFDHAS